MDSIEKVERFFASVRSEPGARAGVSRMTARSFRDKMQQVSDLAPPEKSAIDRWLCSKIRG